MEPQRVSKPSEQKQTHASPSPASQPHVQKHLLLQLQQTVGNQAFQQLLRSGVLQTNFVVSRPGDGQEQVAEQVAQLAPQVIRMRGRQLVEKKKNEHLVQAKETPHHVPEVALAVHGHLDALRRGGQPKRAADSEKAFAPQAKKQDEPLPPVDEGPSKESVAEAAVGIETLRSPATPEDPAYQAVVEDLQIKAKHERTPYKKPKKKQEETKLAANLKPDEIDTQNAYRNHLDELEGVQVVTVEEFMDKFEKTIIDELAKKIPDTKEKRDTPSAPLSYTEWEAVRVRTEVKLTAGEAIATQEVGNQNKAYSDPLRTEAKKPVSEKQESKTYELKVDPAGSTPTIKNAKTAAPKPKTDDAISLDDQSRALDDALLNHKADGQAINIDEGSLAFPISGEKTFDEAGEAKRKAQAEIEKARPRYREEEKEVISKSQDDIQSLVSTGLQDYHHSRSGSFKAVLGKQELHKKNIKDNKQAFFQQFEQIYEDTKGNVDNELKKLNGIEKTFEKILRDAELDFARFVRNNLEYIYTPGHWGFDYSNWIDEHAGDIETEYKRLLGEKYKTLDIEIQQLSRESKTLAYVAKGFRTFGGGDMRLHLNAVENVQDRSALILFSEAKTIFISNVMREVEKEIAKIVVEALNAAKKHIEDGKKKVNEAYVRLSPEEKEEAEAANVLGAVIGKFESLEESVEDRKREVIGDMARTYNQSVGKLQGTFDAIKKDVLTGFFERAWNKLKAVVNAIIDFATRIAELLGRMISLLGDIVSSPRYFFKNLVTGIAQGFSTFVDRIDEFLATAFFDWLRGASGISIQLPKDWGPKGIFSLFTQLLNLSTETVWQRMEIVYDKTTANVFRRGEKLFEKGLEIFGIIKNEGLGGLWDHIKESLGNILEETLGMIKETVLNAAIKKVIFEIGKLLVPGGGFIAIAEKIIRLLQFIVEARKEIVALIESFVASMENAVKGDIPGIVKNITGALTKFITVALDFLVTFFGLGDLKGKVERFIETMRKPIIRGIDWVLGKVKPFVMKAMMKGKELIEKGREKVRGVVQRVVQWWRTRKTFKAADGETHALFFKGEERSAVLTVSTTEMPYTDFVNRAQTGTDAAKVDAKRQGVTIAGMIDTERNTPPAGNTPKEIEESSGQKATRVNDLLEELKKYTAILFGPTIPDSFTDTENVNAGMNEAGFGVSMSVKPLTNKNRPAGSPPTSANNDTYADINERRTDPGGASYYVKGHLLNLELGGPGVWANLTPLSRSGNAQHEKQAEAIVKRTVDLPAIVEYGVIPDYSARSDKSSLLTRIKNSRDSADVKRVKSAIVEGEDWVPRSLSVQAYILDESLRRRNSIMNKTITNPVERNYESYHLTSSPRPVPVNLSVDDARKIATLPGIGQTLAERIVAARDAREGRRFASYEQIAELVQGIGAGRLKTLDDAGHVQLF